MHHLFPSWSKWRYCLEQYKYTALETENTEEEPEEEEEDGGNEEEQEEDEGEGEEEEVDLLKRDRKKNLGNTSIYDPVALVEKNVLLPGKPDFVLAYDGKTYRFANEDNRSIFLQTPLKYIPINKPATVMNTVASMIDHTLVSFLRSIVAGDTRGVSRTRRCGQKFARPRIGNQMQPIPY